MKKAACILLTVCFVLILIGCKTAQPVTQIPVQSVEIIRERLVPVYIPPDSSYLDAIFACDSLNNVYLKELTELKSSAMVSEFSLTGGHFSYLIKIKHDTVYIPAVDTIKNKEVAVIHEVPIYTNILKNWQLWLMVAGSAALAGWVVFGFMKIRR